jgi:hypothetical protein|tara:strand:+ start:851 stop:1039 length:189 start_codon:yes stop_codon:yes gene_type:complete
MGVSRGARGLAISELLGVADNAELARPIRLLIIRDLAISKQPPEELCPVELAEKILVVASVT